MLTDEEKRQIRREIDRRLNEKLLAYIQRLVDKEEDRIINGTGGEAPKGVIRVKAAARGNE